MTLPPPLKDLDLGTSASASKRTDRRGLDVGVVAARSGIEEAWPVDVEGIGEEGIGEEGIGGGGGEEGGVEGGGGLGGNIGGRGGGGGGGGGGWLGIGGAVAIEDASLGVVGGSPLLQAIEQ